MVVASAVVMGHCQPADDRRAQHRIQHWLAAPSRTVRLTVNNTWLHIKLNILNNVSTHDRLLMVNLQVKSWREN